MSTIPPEDGYLDGGEVTTFHRSVRVSATYRTQAGSRCESIDVIWERDPPDVDGLIRVATELFSQGHASRLAIVDQR